MHFSHCFFAGVPGEGDWSQSYGREDGETFFGLVVHVGAPIVEVAPKGKEILSAAMAAALEINRDNFLSFFKSQETDGVNIAALYIHKDRALLYAKGTVNLILSRGETQQTILEGDNSGRFVEGNCRDDDYYIASTNEYLAKFGPPDASKSPQDACDTAFGNLHRVDNSSKASALFVKLHPPKEQSAPEVVPPIKQPEPTLNATSTLPTSVAHVDGSRERRAKLIRLAFLIFVGLILLLAFSRYLTARKSAQLESSIKPYSERYERLLSLSEAEKLNMLSGLRELSRDLTDREKQTREMSLKRAFAQLLSKVNQSFAEVSGEKHLDKLNVYFDFRLIAPDFVASAVAFDIPGKLAVFLDSNRGRLLSLSLEKKEALTLSVDEKLKKPLSLAVENRKAYVLGDEGVMELSLPLDKLGGIVVSRGSNWLRPKLIDVFGTNAYIFDSGVREILKVDLTDTNASATGWLRSKEGIDFDSVVSLRIDGGIWLGDAMGKILHFMQGQPTPFGYVGVLDPPTSSVYVYSTEESSLLYVLEPQAKRLLILTKAGEYQRSIVSEDLSTATGLVVDEAGSKVYILSGSLVYEVGL